MPLPPPSTPAPPLLRRSAMEPSNRFESLLSLPANRPYICIVAPTISSPGKFCMKRIGAEFSSCKVGLNLHNCQGATMYGRTGLRRRPPPEGACCSTHASVSRRREAARRRPDAMASIFSSMLGTLPTVSNKCQ